jgi:hypothetical protein
MPSARIPSFSWEGGDLFNAEIWMLNDSPNTASDTVRVYLEVEGNRQHILTWETGELAAAENKRGHIIQAILPQVQQQVKLNLILESDHGSSSYQLLLQPKNEKVVDHHALNA